MCVFLRPRARARRVYRRCSSKSAPNRCQDANEPSDKCRDAHASSPIYTQRRTAESTIPSMVHAMRAERAWVLSVSHVVQRTLWYLISELYDPHVYTHALRTHIFFGPKSKIQTQTTLFIHSSSPSQCSQIGYWWRFLSAWPRARRAGRSWHRAKPIARLFGVCVQWMTFQINDGAHSIVANIVIRCHRHRCYRVCLFLFFFAVCLCAVAVAVRCIHGSCRIRCHWIIIKDKEIKCNNGKMMVLASHRGSVTVSAFTRGPCRHIDCLVIFGNCSSGPSDLFLSPPPALNLSRRIQTLA